MPAREQVLSMTHVDHLWRAVVFVWPENLDGDLPAAMFMLRYVRKPTVAQYHTYRIPA